MDAGIPVNGVIVPDGNRRLLLIITDLMCCGDGPQSWEEQRRRVEAKVIRNLVRQVLAREKIDGLIIAGDFNLVATALPLVMLSGPYPAPNPGLIGAEIYHLDGHTTWTWDGRGTPFPSRALDYQLYGPNALEMRSGYVFDSEDLPPEALQATGLAPDTSRRLSTHRPLVVTYRWRRAFP
ncbi:MAG: endonuclease/exonuclease/phosphatase family protein [Lysobacterales bacterium]